MTTIEQQKTLENENNEINYDELNDKPIGNKTTYNRPNLDGKTVKILSVKVFNAKPSDKPCKSKTSDVTFKRARFLVTFDSVNEDGVNDRENYSGAVQFFNKNTQKFEGVSFYYDGGETQVNKLWKLVAKHKSLEPKDLSPREFIQFLNSGISVVLKYEDVEYMQRFTKKNIITQIIG